MIEFSCTEEENRLINKIVIRAKRLDLDSGDIVSDQMDIAATHCNGNPLNLKKFLDFDIVNFIHDYKGIWLHINRRTGKLNDCFLPRCSQ